MKARAGLAIRLLDLAGAMAGLVLTLPVWPVIAAAVWADSPGPVLYRSLRLGRGNHVFELLKFRSMHAGDGCAVTVAGDRRITRVGRLLRATKLDELPQLVNVLRGEMSLVGPRPEDPCYLERYPLELQEIFNYRPGITSPATLEFRHEENLLRVADCDPETYYVEQVLPKKAAIDLAYCRSRSVRSDLGILARTVRSLLQLGPE